MTWRTHITVQPTLEPVTLQELKAHRRFFEDDENATWDRLIVVARQQAEDMLGLSLLTQTRVLYLDGYPCARHYGTRIHLPRGPVQSVSSVQYAHPDTGTMTTLAADQYRVVGANTAPSQMDHLNVCYIEPAYNVSWPSIRNITESLAITYVCGWLSRGSIPESIRHAMLVDIGTMDEHREDILTGTIVAELKTIQRLTVNHRCYHEFGSDCG